MPFSGSPPPTIRDLYRLTDRRGEFFRMLPTLTPANLIAMVKASFQQPPGNRLRTRAETQMSSPP